MNREETINTWRHRARTALQLFYGLAGILHLAWPAPFLTITPAWVPFPREVILVTGLCELLGAAGLRLGPVRRPAGICLALYAVCVYPANIKHALDGLGAPDAGALAWLYHLPRLALQPAIAWLPLFAVGAMTWPLRPQCDLTPP